jgi:Amt family ammonium transporter
MGGGAQFMKQAVGLGITALFAFVATYVIAIVIHKTIGLRVTKQDEIDGLDIAVHGERGYHLEDNMFGDASDTAEGHPDARGTAPVGAMAGVTA